MPGWEQPPAGGADDRVGAVLVATGAKVGAAEVAGNERQWQICINRGERERRCIKIDATGERNDSDNPSCGYTCLSACLSHRKVHLCMRVLCACVVFVVYTCVCACMHAVHGCMCGHTCK